MRSSATLVWPLALAAIQKAGYLAMINEAKSKVAVNAPHENEMKTLIETIVNGYTEISEYVKRTLNDNEQNTLCQCLLIIAARVAFRTEQTKNTLFSDAEKFGVHFLPVHFYSPIPSQSEIDPEIYSRRYDNIPGLKIDRRNHLRLLEQLARYAHELDDIRVGPSDTPEFSWDNPAYPPGDAIAYYGIIRHLRPSRVIEIGSGYSTFLAARALSQNGCGELICIEPYPMPKLRVFAAHSNVKVQLIERKVQEVALKTFEDLTSNDILFIDSSHVSKAGSDVNHEVFLILPRLRSGVWCHIHDMFFPWDYAKSWIEELKLFWNEQYLFMAFLAYNNEFQLELANQYVGRELQTECSRLFCSTGQTTFGGGSLWFRRL